MKTLQVIFEEILNEKLKEKLLANGFKFYSPYDVSFRGTMPANQCEQNAFKVIKENLQFPPYEQWREQMEKDLGYRAKWLTDEIYSEKEYQKAKDQKQQKYSLCYGFLIERGNFIHHWTILDNDKENLIEYTTVVRRYIDGYYMKPMKLESYISAKNSYDVKEGKFGFESHYFNNE